MSDAAAIVMTHDSTEFLPVTTCGCSLKQIFEGARIYLRSTYVEGAWLSQPLIDLPGHRCIICQHTAWSLEHLLDARRLWCMSHEVSTLI